MNNTHRNRHLALCASGILACLSGTAGAGTIFTENFNGITGLGLNGSPAGQTTTTHDVGFGGNLAGWNNAGAGTIHAVDTANTWQLGVVSTNSRNWGVMLWQDNVITQSAGIVGSNTIGTSYDIDFLAAGAAYTQASQLNNGTTDGLKIDVLRASDSAVLHTFNQVVAQPIGVGDLGLTAYNFNYSGDGSGDILFRVGPVNAGQGRFQGTIDDLSLSAVPEPTTTALLGLGGLALILRRRK
jgi:hypothetical protein